MLTRTKLEALEDDVERYKTAMKYKDDYLHAELEEWKHFTLALREDVTRLMDHLGIEFKDIPPARIITKKEDTI